MLRLKLRSPPLVSSALLAGIAIIGVLTYGVPGLDDTLRLLIFGSLSLLYGGFYARLRPRQVPDLWMTPEALLLPRNARSGRGDRVPYAEIEWTGLVGGAGYRRLIVETPRRVYRYAESAFIEPEAMRGFVQALERRIMVFPLSDAHRRRLSHRNRIMQSVIGRSAPATSALAVLLAAIYLVQMLFGAHEDQLMLVRMGASVAGLIRDGDWYRMLSASFLHGNGLHLMLNGLALLTLGAHVERLLGSARYVLVYCLTALGGGAATFLANHPLPSVGASTALFGLLGALAGLHLLRRNHMPVELRQTLRWWITVLAINIAIPFAVPAIDGAAHLGGFLTGLAVISLLLVAPGFRGLDREARRVEVTLAGLAAVLTLVAVGAAAVGMATWSPSDDARWLRTVLAQTDLDPEVHRKIKIDLLNLQAWTIATQADADDEALARAHAMATEAVELDPDNAALVDTLATVDFRRGQLDAAIDREAFALHHAPNNHAFYATQLARFLSARMEESGGVITRNGALPDAVEIGEVGLTSQGLKITLHAQGPTPGALRLYLLAREPGSRPGLVRLRWRPDPNQDTPTVTVIVRDPPPTLATGTARLEIAQIDAEPCRTCQPGMTEGLAWRIDKEAASLP